MNMQRRDFLGVLSGAPARPVLARAQRSALPLVVALVAGAMLLSSAGADAETARSRIGLITCESWLSNPAYARDGEHWIYGFWDGLVQGLGYSNRIGQIPDSDLMLDDVRSSCKDKPHLTLAESASHTFERMRQGVFSTGPAGK